MNDHLELQQEWEPSEKDRKAFELARRYHDETEAYDRTVCTGPIRHGSIMPNGHRELALVNRNAAAVLKTVLDEASLHGITRQEIWRAIGRHS